MDMQKRGQVSVFVIIGLVIIAAMIFVFFLFRSFQEKAREITNPQEYLKSQIQDVKKAVVKCIGDESEGALTKLSMQGGHLNPVKYINYYDSKVTFLCYKVKDDEPCYNFMFTRMEIEDELGPLLKKNIKSCVDSSLSPFRKNRAVKILNATPTFDSKATRENWICHGDIARRNEERSAICTPICLF